MILAAITTCRRKPEMVERAVKSVISQTFTNWNLVVVDDSPADYEFREDVRRMVEGYAERDSRIKYVAHDKNYGACHARNTALNIAVNTHRGGGHDFIAYLDDDDEWLPEKLEKQFAKFQECGEDVAMIGCGFVWCQEKPYKLFEYLPSSNINDSSILSMAGNCGPTASPLIRTNCLYAAGGFDENMPARQDWEMWIRMVKSYKVDFVYEILWIYHNYEDKSRVFSNMNARLKAHEIIIGKNLQYLENDTNEYWHQLADLFKLCMICRESEKAFNVWLKMVRLKPLRIAGNLYIPVKELAKAKLPRLFFAIKKLKCKLKGEEFI